MEYVVQSAEWLWNLINPIGITDIVDILILAFIIFQIISRIGHSSSGAVAKGILLLFVLLGISQALQLNAVNYLLGQMVNWGIIAVIVLFQPEIRRFFEQVGRGTFANMFTTTKADGGDETELAILHTVQAYTALSKSKTGALMVFERKNMLDDAIKTGTALDCSVNSELLKNIFWNKAPLHDGAVIVRNGRVVGAGCMLPLSGNPNLSRDLGMRHRAGIGVSESSDAVVATVSEETGSISVAVNGMLKRHLTPETLDRLLRNELMPQPEQVEGNKFWQNNPFRFMRGDKDQSEN